MDTSYILLANTEEINVRANVARARRTNTGLQGKALALANAVPPKQFMLDAGTTRFDSSMWWFVCAYAQRGIAFDHLYGLGSGDL